MKNFLFAFFIILGYYVYQLLKTVPSFAEDILFALQNRLHRWKPYQEKIQDVQRPWIIAMSTSPRRLPLLSKTLDQWTSRGPHVQIVLTLPRSFRNQWP